MSKRWKKAISAASGVYHVSQVNAGEVIPFQVREFFSYPMAPHGLRSVHTKRASNLLISACDFVSKQVEVLQLMPRHRLEELCRRSMLRHYNAGEQLFEEGSSGTEMWIIIHGTIELFTVRTNKHGEEFNHLITLLHSGKAPRYIGMCIDMCIDICIDM